MTPAFFKEIGQMTDIKAGVIVVTKFCKSGSSEFCSYIDYINRDEATRAKYSSKYNLYQDYMGNPEKTTGLFTEQKDICSNQEKQKLKEIFQTAQKNNSLMWQTVISFDNHWLEKNGLYITETGMLDEERLKAITKSAIHKMLDKEGLGNAVWSAAIHYNTDNIHIHIATVEPEPIREKRDYVQYNYEKRNGRMVKTTPKLDYQGRPIIKKEYKGTFRQSSIETCRREIVNQIINEKENNLKINYIIRESIVKQKRQHLLSKDKELAGKFLDLYEHMPDCNRNMWNYNNPIMNPHHIEIDNISNAYLAKYHPHELEELQQRLQIQEQKYKESYGATNRSYAENKMKDLYSRLGNVILKEIRSYDKECHQLTGKILQEKMDFDKEIPLGVIHDPLDLDSDFEQDISLENDTYYSFEEDALNKIKIKWTQKYKQARKLVHSETPQYQKAIQILEQEDMAGNMLATYELGDIYHYGRGKEIDEDMAEKYYGKAFRGFQKLYQTAEEKFAVEYLSYRLGKMYYYGQGIEQDYSKAKILFNKCDSNYATYMLGKMAYAGQGMEQDFQMAYDHFCSIAGSNAYAAYQSAVMLENNKVGGDKEKMDQFYEMAFDGFCRMEDKSPDDNIEYRIGSMYLYGKGTETDVESAKYYLDKSARAGNLHAKNKLAMLYLKQGRQEKIPEIVKTLKDVADKTDNIWSMYALGNIYASEEYGLKDMEKAIMWYEQAEKDGNEFISYRLGKIYMDSESEWYHIKKAVEHMEKAWEKGNVNAGYQLGKIYAAEEYGVKDMAKAIFFYERAAERDNALAAYQLGKIYIEEQEGRQDINKAIHYFKLAAKKDSQYATYQLGKIYYDEKYGVKNDTEAYRWFLESAGQGNRHASYQLGKIDYSRGNYQSAIKHFQQMEDAYSFYYLGKIYLENEKGNPFFDVKKGISYMEQSAKEGNSYAELSLGILYLKGDLQSRDINKAKDWLGKAAEHGNIFANDILKDISSNKTYYPKSHILYGVSLSTALNKMKKGLKSEWEKVRLEREHRQLIEQSIDD